MSARTHRASALEMPFVLTEPPFSPALLARLTIYHLSSDDARQTAKRAQSRPESIQHHARPPSGTS